MQHKGITVFEKIKKSTTNKQEYWSARDLAIILNYSEYRHFLLVVKKAKISCEKTGLSTKKHFEDVLEMVILGSNASRQIKDIQLSRYACYLIMQNADPSKEVVAIGQTYFAIQTRKQKILDQHIEDQKRVFLREEIIAHNKHLAQTATRSGVKKLGVFTNYGYMGLYGGLKSEQIAQKKGVKKNQKILDHMGSEELAANLFRATQTDVKLQRDNIKGEAVANQTPLFPTGIFSLLT